MIIKQAMILAAGLGSRMSYLTKDRPKPMVEVAGITLIERHLRYLDQNNIHKLVINTFYMAEKLERFILSLPISNKFEIYFSREKELLGTAGGIKKALKFLGSQPFFVINNDSIFIDEKPAFKLLEKHWHPEKMKILMLLTKRDNSFGYWLANGDFDMDKEGHINQNNPKREYINPGMYITDYRLFDNYDEEKIELSPTILNDLIKEQKIFGCQYHGKWYHIGDLKAYELFKEQIKYFHH